MLCVVKIDCISILRNILWKKPQPLLYAADIQIDFVPWLLRKPSDSGVRHSMFFGFHSGLGLYCVRLWLPVFLQHAWQPCHGQNPERMCTREWEVLGTMTCSGKIQRTICIQRPQTYRPNQRREMHVMHDVGLCRLYQRCQKYENLRWRALV